MEIETRTRVPHNSEVLPPSMVKRRVLTDAGRLTLKAEQRRNRANILVIASIVVVLALVRIFYALLSP
jgi:hypothetical protein